MCGLFGFAGRDPDFELLYEIACLAETRGPHAFGFAWPVAAQIWTYKKVGLISEDPDCFNEAGAYGPLIGLCRLATSGTWKDPDNNQPLFMGDTAIVHNGNVYNQAEIFENFGLFPFTNCDSEALLVAYRGYAGEPPYRMYLAVNDVDARSPLASLILEQDLIVAARRGHPLFYKQTEAGTYFCSRPWEPDCDLLPDNQPEVFYA